MKQTKQTKQMEKPKNTKSRAGKRRHAYVAAALFVIIVVFIVSNFMGIPNQQTVLTKKDLISEMEALDIINAYPNNRNINPGNYPRFLGIYSVNGMPLTEIYFCSDVCPDYGSVIIIFENVTKNECLMVGGREYIDPAWGGFVGCVPSIERFLVMER